MALDTVGRWQKLHQNAGLVNQWIATNKPSPEKSEQVFQAFMARYGSNIIGSNAFISKTTRVIEKTSRLASGVTILERLLGADKDLIFQEGESSSREEKSLTFNFCGSKFLYPYLNSHGERELAKESRVDTFIHECLHEWHSIQGDVAKEKRLAKRGVLPEMDNAEEELTITGNLHLDAAADADFCCEHTVSCEIGRPLRINHRGTGNLTPVLHDFVKLRILPKLRELAAAGQIHNDKVSDLTALELAMHLRLLDDDFAVLQEWSQVIRVLIETGCHSEHALKVAILENSEELIDLLLQAGAPITEDILKAAKLPHFEDRYLEMWELLEKHKLVPSIEKLIAHPFEVPASGVNPLDRILKELRRDHKIVKAKFAKNDTVPLHTLCQLLKSKDLEMLPSLFATNEAYHEFLAHWPQYQNQLRFTPSSSSLPLAASSSGTAYAESCCVVEPPSSNAFVCKPDHACAPTTLDSCFPICDKFFADFDVTLQTCPRPFFFTPNEVESFLRSLNQKQFQSLATFSDSVLKKVQIGYEVRYESVEAATLDFPMPLINREISLDQELDWALERLIASDLARAFSDPSSLQPGRKEKKIFGEISYVDVPCVTKEGNGLLQQLKHDFEGKHLAAIESLTERTENPVDSLVCRVSLMEHLQMTKCRLYFEYQLYLNGSPLGNATGLGG